jgi:hypothetical protein
MSGFVLPEPATSGASLEVAVQTGSAAKAQLSDALRCRSMGTSLWFGGHSRLGDGAAVTTGKVWSTTSTEDEQLALAPLLAVATTVTLWAPRPRSSLAWPS